MLSKLFKGIENFVNLRRSRQNSEDSDDEERLERGSTLLRKRTRSANGRTDNGSMSDDPEEEPEEEIESSDDEESINADQARVGNNEELIEEIVVDGNGRDDGTNEEIIQRDLMRGRLEMELLSFQESNLENSSERPSAFQLEPPLNLRTQRTNPGGLADFTRLRNNESQMSPEEPGSHENNRDTRSTSGNIGPMSSNPNNSSRNPTVSMDFRIARQTDPSHRGINGLVVHPRGSLDSFRQSNSSRVPLLVENPSSSASDMSRSIWGAFPHANQSLNDVPLIGEPNTQSPPFQVGNSQETLGSPSGGNRSQESPFQRINQEGNDLRFLLNLGPTRQAQLNSNNSIGSPQRNSTQNEAAMGRHVSCSLLTKKEERKNKRENFMKREFGNYQEKPEGFLRSFLKRLNCKLKRDPKKELIKQVTRLKSISHKKNDFICPICLKFLACPINTVCGHAFCEVCLVEYLLFSSVSLLSFITNTLFYSSERVVQFAPED